MNREVAVHHLLGRTVRDPHGRKVGRVEELRVEIELHEQGNDYVVTEFHVGSFGAIESVAGPFFARQLLHRLGRLAPYSSHRIPWDRLDLSDPHHPKSLETVEELKARQRESRA
jgi:sporulation protein YlmC with PRC-barrel domain